MINRTILKKYMGNDKMGVTMIIASIMVIVFMAVILSYQHRVDEIDQVHRQGTVLARIAGKMPTDQLTGGNNNQGLLRIIKEIQSNPYFAYAAVVDANGSSLAEVVEPGVLISQEKMPQKPVGWLGVHEHIINDRDIIEYYAPLIEAGRLAGFVRFGYWKPGYGLSTNHARILAIMALAVFLLTPIFYLLLKNEVKPLSKINEQLSILLNKNNTSDADKVHESSGELMQHFGRVVEAAYQRINKLEESKSSTIISNKLIAYQKNRLEVTLHAFPDAILVMDEAGAVTYANEKFLSLFGKKNNKVSGSKVSDWCNNPDVLAYLASNQASTNTRMYRGEGIYFDLGETDKRISVNAYPLFSQKDSSQTIGNLVLFRDVTNEETEKRIRGEFVAHVAHELKSPLSVLFMYSESLLENADTSKELTIEAANIIHDETERLSEMINNLMNMTKIEMGTVTLHRQRVKLNDLLKDVFETMQRSNEDSDLKFKLNIPHELSTISLDKELVRVSLNNLISNAIKYNKPGGSVELSAIESDEEITISVKDTGIGVSKDDQGKIFSKFYRSDDDEVRKRTGHGLGLSLVSEIIKLHHGDVRLSSEPGKGSEFVVRFNKDKSSLKEAI